MGYPPHKEERAFIASIVWAIGFVVSVLFTLTCLFGGLIQFIELGNIWLGLDYFLLMLAGPVMYFSVEFVAKKIRGDYQRSSGLPRVATLGEESKNA